MKKVSIFLMFVFLLQSCIEREAKLVPPPAGNQQATPRQVPTNQAATNQAATNQAAAKQVSNVQTLNRTAQGANGIVQNHKFLNIGRVSGKSYKEISSQGLTISRSNKDVISMHGWGLASPPLRPFKELFVQIGDQRFKTVYGGDAPYLKKLISQSPTKSTKAGFILPLKTSFIKNGTHKFSLIGIDENGKEYHSAKTFNLTIR